MTSVFSVGKSVCVCVLTVFVLGADTETKCSGFQCDW